MPLKIMSLSDAAVERINEIIADSDKPVLGVRVGVKNAGCAGMALHDGLCGLGYPGDEHVEDKGVHVFIEPKATLFLIGTVMDFEEDILKSGFTFKSPNQTAACSRGESVTLKAGDLKATGRGATGA